MRRSTIRFEGKLRDDYLTLIQQFPLRSIQSGGELKAAQAVMDKLLANGSLSAGAEMYRDALTDLVAAYEDEYYPIEPASDAEILQHFLEAKGISQAELHRDTGISKSTISAVLAGKRPFSKNMMRTLAEYFEVSADVFAGNI